MFSTIYRFRAFLGRYWLLLIGGALFTLGSAVLALAQPWPLKVIVDSVLQNKPVKVPGAGLLQNRSRDFILNVAVAAYVVILVAGAVMDYLGTLLMDSTGERLVNDIRGALFSRLQRLSLRFHAEQRSGDLINRVMNDIDRIQEMLVQSFSVLVPNAALLAGMMAIVLFVGVHQVLSGRLSLGLLLVFLSYIGSLYKPMRQLSKLSYVTSRGVASAERVAEVLDSEMDIRDLPGARPAPKLIGHLH